MITRIAIDVEAPPARIFELARDVSRWPHLLPHYRKVTIESRDGDKVAVRMLAVRPGLIPVAVGWRAEQWPDASRQDDLRLHFRHIGGATRGMKVVWHIRARSSGDRSTVTIEHEFVRPLPLVGPDLLPALVDRLFVRPIAGRTLATFKALAEQEAG